MNLTAKFAKLYQYSFANFAVIKTLGIKTFAPFAVKIISQYKIFYVSPQVFVLIRWNLEFQKIGISNKKADSKLKSAFFYVDKMRSKLLTFHNNHFTIK